MKTINILVILLLFSVVLLKDDKNPMDNDLQEICTYLGYPSERHQVITPDGYNLTLFRIPGKKGEVISESTQKQIVLYVHGWVSSSDDLILNDEHISPGFVFANNGFDLWLLNTRGNYYSKNHRSLDPKKDGRKFWDFSFSDMGKLDLPAAVDFILKKTGQKTLSIVSHSQGGAVVLSALIDAKAKLESKIHSYVAWSPVVRIHHCKNIMMRELLTETPILDVLRGLFFYEFFPRPNTSINPSFIVCSWVPIICKSAVKMFADSNNIVNNMDRLPIFVLHYPSGSSLKNTEHLKQIMAAEEFRPFDYGPSHNYELYGAEVPPPYDFTKMLNVPVALMGGNYDVLADYKDVLWLKWRLEEAGVLKSFKMYEGGHLTFFLPLDNTIINDTMEFIRTRGETQTISE